MADPEVLPDHASTGTPLAHDDETPVAWRERLDIMDDWYEELLAGGYDYAESELLYWFEPHAAYLGSLSGSLIDLGGGLGLMSRFVPPTCDYTVVDPNDSWKAPEWQDFARRFTGGRNVNHVDGLGESLPFPDDSFDNGMAYCSLNHATRADLCIAELARVVRKGGRILLVMEDMEPSWSDVLHEARARASRRLFNGKPQLLHWHNAQVPSLRQTVRRKLSSKPWPTDDDHKLIAEADMRRWFAPRLDLVRREWRGRLLTFELVKAR